MSIGNASVVRSTIPGVHKVQGVWTGGGAGTSMTHAAADWSKGIVSVTYHTDAGKYLITFTDVGQQIVGHNCKVCRPTDGDDPVVVNLRRGSFDSAAKTVEIEIADMDGTAYDLATDELLLIDVEFALFAP